jgi:hypothetical protein
MCANSNNTEEVTKRNQYTEKNTGIYGGKIQEAITE